MREDLDVGRLYVGYRRFAGGKESQRHASDQLQVLNAYAEHYRQLVSPAIDTPVGKFGRDTAVWEASTTHPLALAIATSQRSAEEQAEMFKDIESYLVRRAVCGLTPKNYNKVFIQQMKRFLEAGVGAPALRSALMSLEGDASRWPSDDEFRKLLVDAPMYPGRLDASRTKWLLATLERQLRSPRSEEPIPLTLEQLDVDHILPSSWFAHWPLPERSATEADAQAALLASYSDQPLSSWHTAIRRREVAKARIGNLTLLHYGVNRGLQNHGFPRKRDTLLNESNLHLNRELMHLQVWDEDHIDRRSRQLAEKACQAWPGPR